MPAARRLLILQNGLPIAGVMQRSISINGEAIDITGDAANGWRMFDADVGLRSVDISVEGFSLDNDNTLRDMIMSPSPNLLLDNISIQYPNGDVMDGSFFFSSLEQSGASNEKLGFSATLQSSGEITITAA